MRALGYYLNSVAIDSLTEYEGIIREFCLQKDHNLIRVFHDVSLRGLQTQFEALVEFVKESKQGFLVIIPSVNHLGDDITNAVEKILDVDQMGSEIRCIDDNFPDPIQGLAHRLEPSKSDLQKKMVAGMHQKAAGAFALGKTPFGYKIGSDKKLEIVIEEAEVVRSIFKAYGLQQLGLRKIADFLNLQGVKTRKGKMWSMVTIRDVLKNTTYIGTYTRFGLRLPNSHESIVSPRDFRIVQDLMNSRTPNRRRKYTSTFILTGIGQCGDCGAPLLGVTRNQSWINTDGRKISKIYRYYQCQTATNRGGCAYHTWTATSLESEVISRLKENLISRVSMVSQSTNTIREKDLKVAVLCIANIKKRFEKQIQKSATGLVTTYLLRQLYEQHKAELQSATMTLDTLNQNAKTPSYLDLKKTMNILEDESAAAKHSFLTTIVDSLLIYNDSFELFLKDQ